MIPFRFLALAGALALLASPAASGERAPVVVELFTSQGCNSCPPADQFLGDLAKRDDVLALSLHVDYWDYLGWKDTFASKDNTARQYGYRDRLMGRYVYTPQMVVNGRSEMQGSDRARVATEIVKAKAAPADDLEQVPARAECVTNGDGSYSVRLPARTLARPVPLWLVIFDPRHEVEIRKGENRGRVLVYRNVVREMRQIGEWAGDATEVRLPKDAIPAKAGAAVLAQDENAGPILAAGRLAMQ